MNPWIPIYPPVKAGQRAAIAVEAEDLIEVLKDEANKRMIEAGKHGGNGGRGNKKETPPELIPEGLSRTQNEVRAQLAQTFNTNPRYVSEASRLKRENPQAFEAIKSGQKAITQVKQEEKVRDFKIAFNCKHSKQLYLILKKYP